jgi:ferrochelatase
LKVNGCRLTFPIACVQVIPSWYQRKGYVGAMVDLLVEELKKFRRLADVEIFFSAHGVPKSYGES